MSIEDTEDLIRELEANLAEHTGRKDIEVRAGPWRSHDVSVIEAPDGHPIVDFYSAMRYDPHRVIQAKNYAIDLLKNWEFVKAEADAEKKALKPTFEYIQGQFPDAELRYTTAERDTHFVTVTRREGEKPLVSFDLWFGMQQDDIKKLKKELIPELLQSLEKKPQPTMSGIDYW